MDEPQPLEPWFPELEGVEIMRSDRVVLVLVPVARAVTAGKAELCEARADNRRQCAPYAGLTLSNTY